MIVETFYLTATDADILAAPSRLNSIPYNGTLILEFQSTVNTATASFDVTIQLPDGSTPLESVSIPDGVVPGAMNTDDKYVVSVPATLGGHVIVAATEVGTAELFIRATLMP